MQTLLLWTIVLTASAQSLSPARNGKQKDPTVNVRGCVHGTALLLSEDPGFDVPGRKLDLQGSRRMMRALKEHNGHQEEIVGVLRTRSRNSSVAVKEKRGEKTRVIATGGLAELITPESNTIEDSDEFLTLKGLRLIFERNRRS